MLTRTITAVLSISLLITLAGCGDPAVEPGQGSALPPATTAAGVEGRTFLSTATAGFTLVEGTRVTLAFADGQVTASAGCNIMSGNYTITDGRLVLDGLSMTEMGCDQALMDQDTTIAELIASQPLLRLSESGLDVAGSITISFLDRGQADLD